MSADLRRFPVLLVDDQQSNRWVLKLALSERFDVHAAASGEEALELGRRVAFSVLVTDHRMPGMNGLELARRFQALYPEAERIIITGFSQSPELAGAVAEGLVSHVLPKPVRADELETLLQSLLSRRLPRTL